MQGYSAAFAPVYNRRWAFFARRAAPVLQQFYETSPAGRSNRDVLDLCCGTGQVAVHFLEQGYRVTGLDLSEPMLAQARANAQSYVDRGSAHFVHGDASHFRLPGQFGLVVSTFDALNHLPDFGALQSCFACVGPVLVPGGLFVFDLNTRLGLMRWNNLSVDDGDEATVITRGVFDGGDRAWTRITGYVRAEDGRYERFEQTAFNTAFDLRQVESALRGLGFARTHFARLESLSEPLEEPENESRVFVVAEGPNGPTG